MGATTLLLRDTNEGAVQLELELESDSPYARDPTSEVAAAMILNARTMMNIECRSMMQSYRSAEEKSFVVLSSEMVLDVRWKKEMRKKEMRKKEG
eukprot:scaffold7444_cov231-Chaetoceros_neogracile.AAC.1